MLKIHICSRTGDVEGVQEAIRRGENINSQKSRCKYTPLHWATSNGHLNVVKCLMENGANLYLLASRGRSVVWTTIGGFYFNKEKDKDVYYEIFRLLLEHDRVYGSSSDGDGEGDRIEDIPNRRGTLPLLFVKMRSEEDYAAFQAIAFQSNQVECHTHNDNDDDNDNDNDTPPKGWIETFWSWLPL